MARHMYRAIIIFVILFLYSGVVWSVETESVDLTIEPILSADWTCYIKDGDLYIRNASALSKPIKVRDRKTATAPIINPDLRVSGDLIFITWLESGSKGNNVLYRVLHDSGKAMGDVTVLSKNTNATHVRCLIDTKERIFVMEGLFGEKPLFSLDFSSDNGKTFKKYPLDMKGFSAVYTLTPLIVDDTICFFIFGVKDGKKVLATNSFEVSTAKLSEYRTLKETGDISFVEAFQVTSEPAVIYKTFHDKTFGLEGFIKGASDWEPFSIKAAEGLDVAQVDYHVWDDGRILIVFSGEKQPEFKQRIYRSISNDRGKNWDVKRVDTKQYDTTRSQLPRIAVEGDKVAVVWEDSREIRSKIRMNLSSDRGETWLKKDFPVSGKKKYAFRPRISFTKEAFFIAWNQFKNDEKRVADLATARLRWLDAERLTKRRHSRDLSQKRKEHSLTKSVEEYWNGMIKKEPKNTYRLLDPFYRAQVPSNQYEAQMEPTVYHSYSIEDIKLGGNVALVKVKVAYDDPKSETSHARKETVHEDTYLFIDGKWYKKVVDPLSGKSAIDY